MTKGYLGILLHAHLPYVHHPEHEEFFEERWFFEAVSEAYIPLLDIFGKLGSGRFACQSPGQSGAKITLSFSPTLLHMFSDPMLQKRYRKHLEKQLKLIENELSRTAQAGNDEFHKLAQFYKSKYINAAEVFIDIYKCDLVQALGELANSGSCEFITSAATHAFLPFIKSKEALNAQILLGIETCRRFIGVKPRGIWLPECGYTESLEPSLKDNGIEYFVVESHGILYSDPKPVYATYAPVVTPNGLVVFARDAEMSRQVWSSSAGYPGDADYREFYRDIGYDLDYEYIKEFIGPGDSRCDTGLKYYKITGKTESKEPYDPEAAQRKTGDHAADFLAKVRTHADSVSAVINRPPFIVCPFDAELFGHWWFEGPDWLRNVLENAETQQIGLTTLGEYIDGNPIMQMTVPCQSTWGQKGYNEVWLNNSNDWIYRHLHKAAERMSSLADANKNASGIRLRALNQAVRELLLAQSSDWAFIMKTGTMVDYAEKRMIEHIKRFTRLFTDLCEDDLDEGWLAEIETMDNIFQDLDYRIFKTS